MKIVAFIRRNLTISILVFLNVIGLTGLSIYYNNPDRLCDILWEIDCGVAMYDYLVFSREETELIKQYRSGSYIDWPKLYRWQDNRKFGYVVFRVGDYLLLYISDNPYSSGNNGFVLYQKSKQRP